MHALELRTSSSLVKAKECIQSRLAALDFLDTRTFSDQLAALETRMISRGSHAERIIAKQLAKVEKPPQQHQLYPEQLVQQLQQVLRAELREGIGAIESAVRRSVRRPVGDDGHHAAHAPKSRSRPHSTTILLRAHSQPVTNQPSISAAITRLSSAGSSGASFSSPTQGIPSDLNQGPVGSLTAVRAGLCAPAGPVDGRARGDDGSTLLSRLGPRLVRSRIRALFEERLEGGAAAAAAAAGRRPAAGILEYLFGLRQPSEAVTGPDDGVRLPVTRVIHPASRFNIGPLAPGTSRARARNWHWHARCGRRSAGTGQCRRLRRPPFAGKGRPAAHLRRPRAETHLRPRSRPRTARERLSGGRSCFAAVPKRRPRPPMTRRRFREGAKARTRELAPRA